MSSEKEAFNFAELFPLKYQAHEMPPLESYQARDGAALSLRRYLTSAVAKPHFIFIHGSGAHSAYLCAFVHYLSNNQIANVYTPDLRGHGADLIRRGDINYINQLEHDVVDLIAHIKEQAGQNAHIIIGGHSLGGGLALRFAGGEYGQLISQVILIAPFLGHNITMVKQDAGGWATANTSKIVGLAVLNSLGITAFNGAKMLSFNLPAAYCNSSETLAYSYRLMKGLHPANYKECLMRTCTGDDWHER